MARHDDWLRGFKKSAQRVALYCGSRWMMTACFCVSVGAIAKLIKSVVFHDPSAKSRRPPLCTHGVMTPCGWECMRSRKWRLGWQQKGGPEPAFIWWSGTPCYRRAHAAISARASGLNCLLRCRNQFDCLCSNSFGGSNACEPATAAIRL